MLTETQIYIKIKKYLKNLDWNLLGGEPAGGTDFELPVIEMKGSSTGSSLGSRKIDLVCFKDNFFLLLELKKIFAESDIDKLNDICGSEISRREFMHALDEKHRLPPNLQEENYTNSPELFIKALSIAAAIKVKNKASNGLVDHALLTKLAKGCKAPVISIPFPIIISAQMVIKASFPKPAKNSMGFNGISFIWYGKN